MKKISKYIELYFDLGYLAIAFVLSILMFLQNKYLLATMAFILVFGDAFHLVPRILMIKEYLFSKNKSNSNLYNKYEYYLGLGKQVSSISMTIFYVILYVALGLNINFVFDHIIYFLAIMRIFLCFLPYNNWYKEEGNFKWSIIRNVPFLLMAILIIYVLFLKSYIGIGLAVIFSFLFYLPVVLFSGKNKKVAILMLPKTICYIYILMLCLNL